MFLLIYLLVQFLSLFFFLHVICVFTECAAGFLISLYRLSFDPFCCKYCLSLLFAIIFYLKIFCFRIFKQVEKSIENNKMRTQVCIS